ncbi:hypothetical protein CEXT_198561 [Caerostris extrusa]|uniref:Secreted protein n=1 Tax=Caerostris extrusa TaxID=172846 RepID=A0AAV4XV68_CAEEX|nr:hypothetical protein CEXT_198561 [Caerostris extrusa]
MYRSYCRSILLWIVLYASPYSFFPSPCNGGRVKGGRAMRTQKSVDPRDVGGHASHPTRTVRRRKRTQTAIASGVRRHGSSETRKTGAPFDEDGPWR